jgi:DNA-binding MarR family transcriptional regulator
MSKQSLIDQLSLQMRAQHNARDVFDELVCERLGVNHTDHRCLDILERNGPMTAGALADAAGLSPGAITGVIDRLEKADYARRVRDTEDRRRVLVEITPLARERALELYGQLAEAVRPIYERYTVEQLRVISDFIGRGNRVVEEMGARIRK